LKIRRCVLQSHPIGRGPLFVRMSFNVYGHSPLISRYLALMNDNTCSAVRFLVDRTQLESLPPYPFAVFIWSAALIIADRSRRYS